MRPWILHSRKKSCWWRLFWVFSLLLRKISFYQHHTPLSLSSSWRGSRMDFTAGTQQMLFFVVTSMESKRTPDSALRCQHVANYPVHCEALYSSGQPIFPGGSFYLSLLSQGRPFDSWFSWQHAAEQAVVIWVSTVMVMVMSVTRTGLASLIVITRGILSRGGLGRCCSFGWGAFFGWCFLPGSEHDTKKSR